MAVIGYARVSTTGQELTGQVARAGSPRDIAKLIKSGP
jgi:DNA invertase Pin-like site-specific DNA recombinase